MKKFSHIFLLAYVILSSLPITGKNIADKISITGSWMGKLSSGGIELRVIFNISVLAPDSLIATLDSPDQGAKNIQLGLVTLSGESLRISAPAIMAEYNGIIKNDSVILGTWQQHGNTMTLDLAKLKTAFRLVRPQEPKPPFPYTSQDVTFTNVKFNINLAGTLTMPSGDGPFKAVIMITGSGAQNRNEELMGHKPFLVIADYLSRNGISVLRYDDRGVGGSQGIYQEATSADLATDAEAAFDFLKNNPKINKNEIGLIGHSEGGLIAPILASSDTEIGFIVTLAGPGVIGQQIMITQTEDIGRLSGMKESELKESVDIDKRLYAVLRKEKDNDTAEKKVLALYKDVLEKKKTSAAEIEKEVNQLKLRFGAKTYTWFRYFLTTDPAKYWKEVKCPVLALNGEKDLQVAAHENLTAIQNALKSGGNESVKIVSFQGLNHLFQHCSTGLPFEYGTIEETFSPEVLKIIVDWILAL
jgi:uncharacterized protein